MSAILDIRDLSVAWMTPSGPLHAVEDFSLSIAPGEIVGLVGESGSGKSTAMLAAIRALPAPGVITSGSVTFEDREVLSMDEAELRRLRWRGVSLVPQSALSALNPVLTIGAQIADTLYAHGQTDSIAARSEELMRLVEVDPIHLRSHPHQLSGGMRQRIAVALALALDPPMVIMDEPTTALDVVVERQILRRILALRAARGFSILFITHDLSLLMAFADRVAVLYAGRLVEVADSATIRAGGQHPYTQGLIRSIPRLHGDMSDVRGIPGAPPSLRSLPTGCRFHPRCSRATPDCAHAVPLLRPIGTAHDAACHLLEST
ncbi:MAG: ABC transporter ATP-binding protein [Myxococcota bacterium]|nr:ABC transporter ATP-binding protein [Myxococcota bacterium]